MSVERASVLGSVPALLPSGLVPRLIGRVAQRVSLASYLAPGPHHRIVKLRHHPLLERDDGVVGDVDMLRAHLSTTLGDVAHAKSGLFLQERATIVRVQRMHLQG